jgi:hypothetical protein
MMSSEDLGRISLDHLLYHSSGIGDWLQVSSRFTDETYAELDTVVWSSTVRRVAEAMIPVLLKNSPTAHVRHLILDESECPGWDLIRHSTQRFLPLLYRLPFLGSPWLSEPLMDAPEPVADRFDVIVPSTVWGGTVARLVRDFGHREWEAVIARLEARDTFGLVVNESDPSGTIPEHPRILDLSGKVDLAGAVECLKRAQGYIGIDSFLATLAAQLFEPEDLLIRTRNPYVVQNPWAHYGPHLAFPFLVPTVGHEPHETPPMPSPEGKTLVQLTAPHMTESVEFPPGWLLEFEPSVAEGLVSQGKAIPYTLDAQALLDTYE